MNNMNPFKMIANPTLPKFYWEVKSQEQLIKFLCSYIVQLADYANEQTEQINTNADGIKKLQEDLQSYLDGGFDNFYSEQIEQWVTANMPDIIASAIKMVFFGLTPDGYFCAWIPSSWAGITFDTGAVYGRDDYGCLILKY